MVLVESGLSSFPLRARTGADGTVVMGPIAPGPATLSASAAGFVGRGLAMVPLEPEGEVVIALLKGGVIEGEVVDHDDRPVDGATVEVIGTDLSGFPIAETPMSNALRRSHFAWSLGSSPTLMPAGELGVMPGPIPPIPPPSALDAFTFVEPSYNAGPGAFAPKEGVAPWVTGLNGSFVAKPVTPGRVRAIVRHPAYVEGISEVVSLAPDGRVKVKIVLLAGGSLEGRVVDKHGRGVSEARVDLTAVRGTLERTTLTATDGSFAFAAVPAEVVLSVYRPEDLSRAVVRKTVEVEEGKRETVTITLPDGRETVAVKVVDDRDQPIETAQVSVVSLNPDVPLRQTVFTFESGTAEGDGCPGSFRVDQCGGAGLHPSHAILRFGSGGDHDQALPWDHRSWAGHRGARANLFVWGNGHALRARPPLGQHHGFRRRVSRQRRAPRERSSERGAPGLRHQRARIQGRAYGPG